MGMAMRKASAVFSSILQSLPSSRPLESQAISQIVKRAIEGLPEKHKTIEWENAIRADLFQFVVRQAHSSTRAANR